MQLEIYVHRSLDRFILAYNVERMQSLPANTVKADALALAEDVACLIYNQIADELLIETYVVQKLG